MWLVRGHHPHVRGRVRFFECEGALKISSSMAYITLVQVKGHPGRRKSSQAEPTVTIGTSRRSTIGKEKRNLFVTRDIV